MTTATATTVTMPKLGESVTEGTVGAWLKRVGERVDKYEPLVEVVTDKVNAEVPAPVAGVLVEILVEPETTVPVGRGICRIEEPGTPDVAPAASTPLGGNGATGDDGRGTTGSGGVAARAPLAASASVRRPGEIPDEAALLRARSSPVVRRIAAEHGVDIGRIGGSGIGGRVTKQDLLAHLAGAPSSPTPARSHPTPARSAAPLAGETAPAAPVIPEPGAAVSPAAVAPPPVSPVEPALPAARTLVPVFPGDEVVPLSPMRRAIAEHMVRSERTAPHATVVVEVDMSGVAAARAAQKEEFRRREGIELSYLPFALKAATQALRDHPRLNAVWDEDRIVHRGAVHVGVAVALEDGLVVPVIRHADRLSIAGLAHAVAELATKARAGTLTPDDLAGGTFTVNNPGTFGSIVSTPILVQPQVAILSTEAVVKRPVVVGDAIAVRSMMNLSLSIDHRALDGLAAARFLGQVKGWLEGVDEGTGVY